MIAKVLAKDVALDETRDKLSAAQAEALKMRARIEEITRERDILK